MVSLEKFHFFLEGLAQLSKAECVLSIGFEYQQIEHLYATSKLHSKPTNGIVSIAERLEKAVSLYWKALATFKVIFFYLNVMHSTTIYCCS